MKQSIAVLLLIGASVAIKLNDEEEVQIKDDSDDFNILGSTSEKDAEQALAQSDESSDDKKDKKSQEKNDQKPADKPDK